MVFKEIKMDSRVTRWNSNIETGIPEIDDQHRRLFELAASFRGQGDEIRIMKSLAILCDYAKVHLREEEALLETIGYTDLAAHRQAHVEFRALLRQLLTDATHLSLDEIATRVESLINGWFYNHILRVDAQYVPAVAAYQNYQQSLRAGRRNRRLELGSLHFFEDAKASPPEPGSPPEIPPQPGQASSKAQANHADEHAERNDAICLEFSSGNYTQAQIAEHFGVHYSTVSRILKKGRRRDIA